ncbi:hypothetical protein AA23498_0982 [Acetobacter nitrogenifigens DSM 23921 = NBRC 105050]|nr:hypothetical protein AA23498_0982 [Acetobacter nitrogenifigens DSM 23921 = NBRC 105050]
MTHRNAIISFGAPLRTGVNREQNTIAFSKRNDRRPRLHTGPLFGQDELATGEIRTRFRKKDRNLKRKNMIAIEILMQAIVISLPIFQKKGRRFRLTGGMAPLKKICMAFGKAHGIAYAFIPAIGNRDETWVQRRSCASYQGR